MSGRLVAVVGPSGVGKDTVMEAMSARDPRLGLVRRVITRPAAAGGEAFEGVSEAEFRLREAAGAFALSWRAHGLHYGIPRTVRVDLAERDLLVNLSRKVLGLAAQVFPGLVILRLTAPVEVRAARLAARGRECADDIAARLERSVELPADLTPVDISNAGELDETVDAALAALYPAVS